MEQPKSTIVSVSTAELYDRWAKFYDTDGNMLQAIDDTEVPPLIAMLFAHLTRDKPRGEPGTKRFKITELGCGTGRNTSKLLKGPFSVQITAFHALDLSAEMLKLARQACLSPKTTHTTQGPAVATGPTLHFQQFDALDGTQSLPLGVRGSDAVLSTLVLEHLPLDRFFATVAEMLGTGGWLLITNMHEEMGRKSQAGFVDVANGVKIRGQSFVHGIEEVVEVAARLGFELMGPVRERGVMPGDLHVIGARGKKWVGCQVWFGAIFRYVGTVVPSSETSKT
ncbi:MAG: hypothetical protein M1818_008226 [Claussenomyces sp. TS43310]|nr:MAG: hypothetical protein M1818_008226 [Claussenomyces sp. TS43310]